MSKELGIPLTEYLRTTTHRQHQLWLEWLEQQWNKPDRTDHYLMQIAWAAFHAFASKRPPFKSKEWELPFKTIVDAIAKQEMERQEQPDSPLGEGPRRLTKEDIAKINTALAKARNQGKI